MIRRAKLSDAKAINRLNDLSLGYSCELDMTQRLLASVMQHEDHVVLVFEAEGEVLGYLHGERYLTLYEGMLFNVLGLAVGNEAQGKGIGSKLLTAFEAIAKEEGAKGVRLNSGSQRVEAHRFYEKMGYDGTKIQKRLIKWFE